MIPLLLYAQATDLVTFLLASEALGFDGNEYGVLAVAVHDAAGIPGIAALKVLLVILIAVTIATLPSRARWIRGFTGTFAIVAGTLGALTNVVSLAVSV